MPKFKRDKKLDQQHAEGLPERESARQKKYRKKQKSQQTDDSWEDRKYN